MDPRRLPSLPVRMRGSPTHAAGPTLTNPSDAPGRFFSRVAPGQAVAYAFPVHTAETDHGKGPTRAPRQGKNRILTVGWKWVMLVGFLGLGGAPAQPPSAAPQIELLNGRDFTGWRTPVGAWQVVGGVELDPEQPTRLRPVPGTGVVWNGPSGRTVHLISEQEFGDAEIHVEFCLARRSNSGVYLMGRYEVQIYDSHGVERDKYPGIECGGIYPRWVDGREVEGHSPRVNASRPAGEWQYFDIVFRAPRFDATGKKVENARFVRVVHNGQVIHENVEVTGPTRSALFEDEQAKGPLMLQGDHGPIAFRNVRVRPLQLP